MNRNAALWVIVLFFASSLVFGGLRRLTEDSSTGVTVAVQLGALALILGVIVWVARGLRR